MIFPQSGVMNTTKTSKQTKSLGKEVAYDFEKRHCPYARR